MVSPVFACLSTLLALAAVTVSAAEAASAKLPVFFFHGVTGNRHSGDSIVANLTAEGRTVVPLSFCEDDCSFTSIKSQVPLAIQQIRGIVKGNRTFARGYIFIGHSQGGQISRSVIETMGDHNVHTYVSLAGVQNGIFYGPQDAALVAGMGGMNNRISGGVFPFDNYSTPDFLDGTVSHDLHEALLLNPQWHYEIAYANHERTPVHAAWAASNPHLPLINNVNPCAAHDADCTAAKAKRKANFLKLKAAHFFGSAADGVITPWQSSLLGQTSEVESLDDIVTGFQDFTILNMTQTREYKEDTYGLQTLDKLGGLFIHDVANVTHSCWVRDQTNCDFDAVYDKHIYPLLQ